MFVSKSAQLRLAVPLLLLGACAAVHAGTWVKRSSLGNCTDGYIAVGAYTLPDSTSVPAFCFMKNEAKASYMGYLARSITGGNQALLAKNNYPVSEPEKLPWTGVTWQDAVAACASSGATLITENQWLSIAHQVVTVPGNWTNGAVGNGALFSGHNDNAPASALAASAGTDGYSGTGQTTGSQRRTLTLLNGNVIWDIAGNAAEWVNQTISTPGRYHGGDQGAMSYNANDGTGKIAVNVLGNKIPPAPYTALHGMGRYNDGSSRSGATNNITESPENCTGSCATTTTVFARGEGWSDGLAAGVFALNLSLGKSYASSGIGFRCVKVGN